MDEGKWSSAWEPEKSASAPWTRWKVDGERCWTSIGAQMEAIGVGGERWRWNGHSLGDYKWWT